MSIVTRMEFPASSEEVWRTLLFYEEIPDRPPRPLRLLLPLPIRSEGRKSAVGDEATCFYPNGHLLKRVTRIEHARHYGFEVVEQRLALGRGIALSGGSYMLRELAAGRTEVALETRYVSERRPRWLWGPMEAVVCSAFHRHLLRAMRRKLETARAVAP